MEEAKRKAQVTYNLADTLKLKIFYRRGMQMKFVISLFIMMILITSSPIGNSRLNAESDAPHKPIKGLDMNKVERGRYIAITSGCNDCHTPGYLLSEGKVSEDKWLTGDSFGWRGPWGTTYSSNLRLVVNQMTEEQFIDYARTLKRRPPMPWYSLNQMTEYDLKSIYQFIRYLGPAGKPAPAYVPPDQEPTTPYALFPPPPE